MVFWGLEGVLAKRKPALLRVRTAQATSTASQLLLEPLSLLLPLKHRSPALEGRLERSGDWHPDLARPDQGTIRAFSP